MNRKPLAMKRMPLHLIKAQTKKSPITKMTRSLISLRMKAVLTAVAKMIDENNTRLAQQLKSLAPQSNEGKDI